MYMTLRHRSPCEKMASARPYSTIRFDRPGESRNACALKLGVRVAIRRRYPAGHEAPVHNDTGDPPSTTAERSPGGRRSTLGNLLAVCAMACYRVRFPVRSQPPSRECDPSVWRPRLHVWESEIARGVSQR